MIRNVVMGRLVPDADEAVSAELDAALAGIAALQLPGLVGSTTGGRDARLRDGGWDFAIVNDFDGVEAYRTYDHDPEHLGYRAAIAAVCVDLARVQFEVPDA